MVQWESDPANSFGPNFDLYKILWQSYRFPHEIHM